MTSQMDGVFFESILDNDFRMTRLATGETELYKLANDPHEFTNLATNPEYAPVIAKLETHLSFSYPEIPADGWIEAESIPAQTSADYKLRGNCHYSRSDAGASRGRVVCADLRAGAGSYIDFVLDVKTPGTYRLGGTIAAGGAGTVQVDDVKNDAAQSDNAYPMTTVGTLEAFDRLQDVSLGVVRFEKPGLKIIRFVSSAPKQQIKFDRLRLLKADKAQVTESQPSAPAPSKPISKTAKNTWGSKAEWNQDRPGFDWAFPFIDQNRDGQIDPTEYKALQHYKKTHGKAWKDRAKEDLESVNR